MPNVHLTPQMQEFAEREIATGAFANLSEVVRAGMRKLMEERGAAAFYALKADLNAAADELERGRRGAVRSARLGAGGVRVGAVPFRLSTAAAGDLDGIRAYTLERWGRAQWLARVAAGGDGGCEHPPYLPRVIELPSGRSAGGCGGCEHREAAAGSSCGRKSGAVIVGASTHLLGTC